MENHDQQFEIMAEQIPGRTHHGRLACDRIHEDRACSTADGRWTDAGRDTGERCGTNRCPGTYLSRSLSHTTNDGIGRGLTNRLLRWRHRGPHHQWGSTLSLLMIGFWVWGGIYFRV